MKREAEEESKLGGKVTLSGFSNVNIDGI
jgi:hypothetical protein